MSDDKVIPFKKPTHDESDAITLASEQYKVDHNIVRVTLIQEDGSEVDITDYCWY